MNSWTICYHSFHLGFLSPKAWFYTLSKVLSNNNSSNSFNLFILKGRMGRGLFSCTLVVSCWPFQSWIWAIRLCFSLSILCGKLLIALWDLEKYAPNQLWYHVVPNWTPPFWHNFFSSSPIQLGNKSNHYGSSNWASWAQHISWVACSASFNLLDKF